MIALAARHADVWDTFPPIAKRATVGTEDDLGARVRLLGEAARGAGRDPAAIRRSTWTGAQALRSPEAFRAWIGA